MNNTTIPILSFFVLIFLFIFLTDTRLDEKKPSHHQTKEQKVTRSKESERKDPAPKETYPLEEFLIMKPFHGEKFTLATLDQDGNHRYVTINKDGGVMGDPETWTASFWRKGTLSRKPNDTPSDTFQVLSKNGNPIHPEPYESLEPLQKGYVIARNNSRSDIFSSDPETGEMVLLNRDFYTKISPWTNIETGEKGLAFYEQTSNIPVWVTYEKLPEFLIHQW